MSGTFTLTRRARAESARRPRRRVAAVASYGVLSLYAVISLYPFVWMLAGALRNSQSVLNAISPLPTHPSLRYLSMTWSQLHFDTYLVNSVRVTGVAMLIVATVYPLAAYALAVLKFPLRGIVYGTFIAIMFVPGISVLLPLILLEHSLGLLNTRVGLSLAFVNSGAPLAILLLVSYFRSLPSELHQAAQLDGATEWTIFRRIYYPLARPAVAAVVLILMVGCWNDYLFSSVSLASPSRFTLPLGLQGLLSTSVIHWNNVMAGSTILVLPLVVVFLCGQRYFFNGLSGAIKG